MREGDVKIFVILVKMSFGFALLIPVFYIFNLELFVIPRMMFEEYGQLGVTVHVLGIIFLILGSGLMGSWVSSLTIFKTHEKLVSTSITPVISAIDNLAVGKWSADSNTYARLIDTGARMGFAMGKATVDELDRGQVEAGLAGMALPSPKQVAGQSTDEVTKMQEYMNSLDARKGRLSE